MTIAMLDFVALGLGRGLMAAAGVMMVAWLLWLSVEMSWKAIRLSAFGYRVLKAGFEAERKRVLNERASYSG